MCCRGGIYPSLNAKLPRVRINGLGRHFRMPPLCIFAPERALTRAGAGFWGIVPKKIGGNVTQMFTNSTFIYWQGVL